MHNRLSSSEQGMINPLLVPFILVIFFFIFVSGFAVWAYIGRTDYKTNTDQKIAAAVQKANDLSSAKKELEFVEREKLPTKVYRGPDAYGSVSVSFPKTWSTYYEESNGGSNPINAYMHPDKVPSASSDTSYALRVQILNTSYDSQVKSYESQIKQGTLKSSPYRATLVPNQLGVRLDGQLSTKRTGSMIIMPIRDKTLLIYNESADQAADFNTIVLPSLKFIP